MKLRIVLILLLQLISFNIFSAEQSRVDKFNVVLDKDNFLKIDGKKIDLPAGYKVEEIKELGNNLFEARLKIAVAATLPQVAHQLVNSGIEFKELNELERKYNKFCIHFRTQDAAITFKNKLPQDLKLTVFQLQFNRISSYLNTDAQYTKQELIDKLDKLNLTQFVNDIRPC